MGRTQPPRTLRSIGWGSQILPYTFVRPQRYQCPPTDVRSRRSGCMSCPYSKMYLRDVLSDCVSYREESCYRVARRYSSFSFPLLRETCWHLDFGFLLHDEKSHERRRPSACAANTILALTRSGQQTLPSYRRRPEEEAAEKGQLVRFNGGGAQSSARGARPR